MTETRIATDVDRVADTYLDEWAAHDPMIATYLGIAGHDAELPDLSPDWFAARSDLRRRTLAALGAAEPTDANDRVTVAALRETLTVEEELRVVGAEESDLKNIASPAQTIRDIFDLTPTTSADDWATVSTRLAAVPKTMAGYIESLRFAAARGDVAPRRQVQACLTQGEDNVGPGGFFATFAREAAPADGGELPPSLRADLERNAAAAAHAYEELSAVLRDELMAQAPTKDAVGSERYALFSRANVGAQIDLAETYAWGQEELARIVELMDQTAERIKPGASAREAMDHLDNDRSRTLADTDALQAWMQGKSDEAVAALADTHFDIPEPIRRLECKIAPTQQGGIYYTGPSDDLVTRP
ncbi:MAG: DUF885 domain-containing protein, partial [Pseudonocardiales bacterium]